LPKKSARVSGLSAKQKGKATGHCHGKVFRQTVDDTLVWMWHDYEAK
jgi:hypothetical protein